MQLLKRFGVFCSTRFRADFSSRIAFMCVLCMQPYKLHPLTVCCFTKDPTDDEAEVNNSSKLNVKTMPILTGNCHLYNTNYVMLTKSV